MRESLETWSAGLVGKTLAGRYRVTDILGAGGVGAVFAAQHVAVGRRVALKVLHPEFQGHGSIVERFHREARAAAACAREGVVDVLDLDRDPACGPFLVMEYLEGETLSARLRARAPLPPEETLRIVRALLATLAVVHARGIVHRDLKPANIMLALSPEGREVVKMLDFGLAREMTTSTGPAITLPGSVLGTPRFMAPEQAAGDPSVDARADIYAIGAILYCCLGARPPYSDVPPEEALTAVLLRPPTPLARLRPDLAAPVLDVVARAMARDRDERFPDVAALHTALEIALAGFDESSTLVESGNVPILVSPRGAEPLAATVSTSQPGAVEQPAALTGPPSTLSYPPRPHAVKRNEVRAEMPTTSARSAPAAGPAAPVHAQDPTVGTRAIREPSNAVARPSARAAPAPRSGDVGPPPAAPMQRRVDAPLAAPAGSPGAPSRRRDWWWIVPTVVIGLAVVVGLPAWLVSRLAGRFELSPGGAAPSTTGAGSSAAASPAAPWRQERAGRCLFAIPSDWQPRTSNHPAVVAAFASPGVGNEVRPNVAFSDEPYTGTLESYIAQGEEHVRRANAVVVTRGVQALGAANGTTADTVWEHAPTPYREVSVHAVLDGRGYGFRCMAAPTDSAGIELCRAIVRTVRLE